MSWMYSDEEYYKQLKYQEREIKKSIKYWEKVERNLLKKLWSPVWKKQGQPVICPSHTHVIHRYVPYNRYYYQYTTDEETQCPGQANNGNNNNFGM